MPHNPHEDEPAVLSVHYGPSANCSSVGSVVDMLFVSTTVAAAALGAVIAIVESRAKKPGAKEPHAKDFTDKSETQKPSGPSDED